MDELLKCILLKGVLHASAGAVTAGARRVWRPQVPLGHRSIESEPQALAGSAARVGRREQPLLPNTP